MIDALKRVLIVGAVVCLATQVFAEEEAQEPGPTKAELPLTVYDDSGSAGDVPYIPSGWMGNTDALEYDDGCADKPHGGSTCIKVTYNAESKWAGIVWQSPADDWGDEPGGYDLTGAKQLSFWARGDKGGEVVEFKMGIIAKNKPYHDTSSAALGKVKLDKDWKQFTIDLSGKNLKCIKTGFVFSVAGKKEPITFYIDDIKYE